ncbi:AEC family transporter [Roseococcus sp. DSY-14]|uniref:AEC family transporter n=1 Tax=Roseococcus sp. DSY-14 TaxID=3369650 RepID=UPI00387B8B4C
MTALGTVLAIAAPVFLVIGAGYLAAARGLVDPAGFRGLNAFAFNLAAPALLFAGGTAGHAGGGGAALAFFLGAAALYLPTLLLARPRLGLARAGTLALDATFGNTVMMGIPLVAAAFGQAGLAILVAILALHSMVILGTATVVAEVAAHPGARPWSLLRATLGGVLRNPIVMAVLLALVWSSLALPVPGPLRRTLELLGAAAPPVSLFCLGGSLAAFRATGAARTGLVAALKLLALPLLVWGFCRALALPPLDTAVAVVTAALPTGANAFLMARRYATGAEESGAAVLVTTALAIGTLSAALAFLAPA